MYDTFSVFVFAVLRCIFMRINCAKDGLSTILPVDIFEKHDIM